MTPQLTLPSWQSAVEHQQKLAAKTGLLLLAEPKTTAELLGRYFTASLFTLTTEVTWRISFSFSFKVLWCEMNPVNIALTSLAMSPWACCYLWVTSNSWTQWHCKAMWWGLFLKLRRSLINRKTKQSLAISVSASFIPKIAKCVSLLSRHRFCSNTLMGKLVSIIGECNRCLGWTRERQPVAALSTCFQGKMGF